MPVLLTAACLAPPARAQEAPYATPAPHRVWAAAGFGGGGGGGHDVGVIGFMAQLVYERRPHYFALRAIGLADFSDHVLSELGFLYGRVAIDNMFFASASTGLSAVYLEPCGSTDRDCMTVGIPLVAELAVTPLDVLGIGLQLFGNLNLKVPYAGLFVMVPIGSMP